jgi:type IV pilus secretin PilQ/predicted competence protein
MKKALLLLIFIFGLSCSSKNGPVTENSQKSASVVVENIVLEEGQSESVVAIKASGEPKYNVFKLTDPERIVIDLIGAQLGSNVPDDIQGNAVVSEVRAQMLDDSLSSFVRLEVVVKETVSYLAGLENGELFVRILHSSQEMPKEVAATEPKLDLEPPFIEEAPLAQEAPAIDVQAEPKAQSLEMPSSDLEVSVSKPKSMPEPMAKSPQVIQPAPRLEPVKDEVAFGSKQKNNDEQPLQRVKSQEIPTTDVTEGTSLLADIDRKNYTGRRVSLEFQNASVVDVVRIIADVSKLNIVTSNVKGTITLKLIDVPWDQALDIILTSQGLDKVQYGNILRIAPIEQLKKEREIALANDKAAKELEPLKLKLLNVNYAQATDMSGRIKNLLSARGTVDVDPRTNTMIIKDIQEHISRIESLVRVLDTQTPQVRIESRIVQANDQFAQDIGIQWGPTLTLDESNNKQRGWQFPRTIKVGTGDTPGFPTNLSDFAVDAIPGSDFQGGSLGFRLGSINNIFNLDLKLRYAETESLARIVSRPSVTVLDNKTARIIQGTKIPFFSTSSSGTNVEFQDAGIEINVTPQITNDGSVILKVTTKSNEPGSTAISAAGPTILIREAQTEMLVKSGRTAVLGGVFKTSTTKGTGGVPGLMRVPVLGWLFKSDSTIETREETLIFITPTILNDRQKSILTPMSAADFDQGQ